MVIYILMSTILMGVTFTNFGITVRQKNVVMPVFTLIYAYVRVASKNTVVNCNKRNRMAAAIR